MNEGDTASAPAMLLKPSTSISVGSVCFGSMSTPISALTVRANSVRFRRWMGT